MRLAKTQISKGKQVAVAPITFGFLTGFDDDPAKTYATLRRHQTNVPTTLKYNLFTFLRRKRVGISSFD